jgi:primosomal protein N' (replication factor Y)
MDMDSTSRKGSHEDILSRFSKEGPALLLGTQMIAKGHHIPEVTLVGVISADTGLFLPDFRAAERSWQLLEQVAGRSGRGKRAGRVIVQTLNPDHPVLMSLAANSGDDFLDGELRERRLLRYPPFRKLVSLMVSAPEEALAERAAERLILRFRENWPDHPGEILGPVEAALAKLKGRHRRQILFKGRLSHEQKAWFPEAFAALAKEMKRSGALSLDLDVDPESLL